MSQGRTHTFASLLEDVDFVEIPIIQRDYAQGRPQAADVRANFLDALRNALRPGGTSLDLDFVYGSVTSDGARILSVLDGQQRLTTLFLLHWYLATREDQLDDFHSRWLTPGDARSRFSYATRPSAAEFFQALARSRVALPEGADARPLSAKLLNAKWFFDTWRQDPTVNSCLVMLDAIHRAFGSEADGMYAALLEQDRVTFHFLNLLDFGLSDDLYIKMNARGKALTPFENFKAWLVEQAGSEPWASDFALRLDQRWLDFFWDLSGRSGGSPVSAAGQEDYGELFLRFFHLQAYFETCLGFPDWHWAADPGSRLWLSRIREARGYVPLRDFETHGVLRAPALRGAMAVLDFLSDDSGDDATHATLAKALAPRAGYEEYLQLHAISAFVCSPDVAGLNDDARALCLRRWRRVATNLVRNSRIDDPAIAVSIVKGLSALAANVSKLYETLAVEPPKQLGFSKEQAAEESRKAALILQDPAWEALIEDAESHWYLQGRIGFLLDLATAGTPEVDMARFQRYTTAMRNAVTRDVLDSPKHLLPRALLSLYDYLPATGGGNHTFCVSNATAYRDRLENWLPVFQDPRFGILLDAIEKDGPGSLQRLVDNSSATGWRRHAVAWPELISYCRMRLARRHGDELLLLSKSRTTGFFAEAKSLALYYDLLQRRKAGALPGIDVLDYTYVYGEEWPNVRLRTGAEYRISFRDGQWQCFAADGSLATLPEAVAEIIREDSPSTDPQLA